MDNFSRKRVFITVKISISASLFLSLFLSLSNPLPPILFYFLFTTPHPPFLLFSLFSFIPPRGSGSIDILFHLLYTVKIFGVLTFLYLLFQDSLFNYSTKNMISNKKTHDKLCVGLMGMLTFSLIRTRHTYTHT